jgi:ubiquitin carboxyl-terminal hydrolase 4/11/15
VSTPLVSEDEDEDSGNGQRLDASSRNGSSSASTGTGAVAGAVALRGGGSQPLAGRGSHLKNAVGAEDDEGFVDEEEEDYSGAVTTSYNNDSPTWGWGHLPAAADAVNDEPNNSDDEVASNHANMADSVAGSPIEDRMMDFGDDEDGVLPSAGTVGAHPTSPIEGVSVGYDDDAEVHEINLV